MSRYLIFGAVSLSLILAAITGTAVAVAFPVIQSSFDASLVSAGWVLTVYQLAATAAMPLAGKAADVFGKKVTFLTCLALFTIGSVLCAIAPNIQLLIVFRFIQAAGGGGFLPVSAGIVAETFPKSRQQYIGLLTSIFPIGQIIGPNVGGWLVSSYGWRSVFWLNIPIAVAALIISVVLLKPGAREPEGTIDLTGAGLFTGSLFAFLTGLSGFSDWGLPAALSGLLIAVGVGLMLAFIRHIKRARDPIISHEVLRAKPFMAANIYNLCFGASLFLITSFIPLYAVSVYGMGIFESGLILTPRSVSIAIASTITSIFLVRWGYRSPMVSGTIVIVLSLVLLGVLSPGTHIFGLEISSTVLLASVMFISGIGMGLAAPAANNACIELMPDRIASITGVRGMFRQMGGAIGVAAAALLLNNIQDMARGFTIVFFALAGLMLLVFPLIFAMPKSALMVDNPPGRSQTTESQAGEASPGKKPG